jgi:hypothetical protein
MFSLNIHGGARDETLAAVNEIEPENYVAIQQICALSKSQRHEANVGSDRLGCQINGLADHLTPLFYLTTVR